jgi:hypothetical protein
MIEKHFKKRKQGMRATPTSKASAASSRLKRQKLARRLAEGYRAHAEVNRTIAEDFMHVDSENF